MLLAAIPKTPYGRMSPCRPTTAAHHSRLSRESLLEQSLKVAPRPVDKGLKDKHLDLFIPGERCANEDGAPSGGRGGAKRRLDLYIRHFPTRH